MIERRRGYLDLARLLVGYEMLGEAQRDLMAEAAAARLREQSEVHFDAVRST